MKTILRIIVILLVAAVIAGGFTLAVNNTSIAAAGVGGEGGKPTDANEQTLQPPSRPDEGGVFGLVEILGTLGKLAGITALVLLIEKAVAQFGKRVHRPTVA
jgi:hypothetical protein